MKKRKNTAKLSHLAAGLCISLILTSCGLGKMSGATNEVNRKATQGFASSLAMPSGIARVSGPEIMDRLFELFPKGWLGIENFNSSPVANASFRFESQMVRSALRIMASPGGFNPEKYYSKQNFSTDIYLSDQAYVRAGFRSTQAFIEGLVNGLSQSPFAPALQSLGGTERETDALHQLQSRLLFDKLCSAQNLQAPQTLLFSDGNEILLSGESFPTDPIQKIAFVAARRGWSYPYAADSPEVQVLSDVYRNSPSGDERKNLCLTVVLSEQFWMSNPFPDDALRRISSPIAGRNPSFKEIEDYRAKKFTLKQFAAKLQTEPAYRRNYLRWHGEHFGLRSIDTDIVNRDVTFDATGGLAGTRVGEVASNYTFDPSYRPDDPNTPAPTNGASYITTSMAANVDGFIGQGIDGCMPPLIGSMDPIMSGTKENPSEAPQFNRPFDPRTTGVIWKQYNNFTQKFEVTGGHILKPFYSQYTHEVELSGTIAASQFDSSFCQTDSLDPRWLNCDGLITLNGSGTKRIPLQELKALTNGGLGGTPASSSESVFAGTPMQTLPAGVDQYHRDSARYRRVVRLSPPTTAYPDGRNVDTSRIHEYYSNRDLDACNSIIRFTTTCYYQPKKSRNSISHSYTYTADWNPNVRAPSLTDSGGMQVAPTVFFAHPEILNSFRCGVINPAQLSSASLNLDQAIPYGYEPLPELDSAAYNSSGSNQQQIPASWLASLNSPGSVPDQSQLNQVAHPLESRNGFTTAYTLSAMMMTEPYNLIEDIISNNKPYSLLVKADYTIIEKPLELYYRSQGGILGMRPQGYTAAPDPGTYGNRYGEQSNREKDQFPVVTLRFQDMQSYPKRLQDMGAGGGMISTTRPSAGILQMPATLESMRPGTPRSISARVFKRFLCSDANFYNPASDGKSAMHLGEFNRMPATVLPSSDPNGNATDLSLIDAYVANHLKDSTGKLRTDCMGCHQNLDPLAMALFKNYGTFVARKTDLAGIYFGAEVIKSSTNRDAALGTTIIPENQGTSAFLGEMVTGYSGVGTKLSTSKQFYSCAAETAFKNLFGRAPSSYEAQLLYKNAVDAFVVNKNYNLLIQNLAAIQENLGGQ